MTLAALIAAVEAFAPRSLAEPWDNTGLLLGGPDDPLSGPVLLAIDLTDSVLDEAAACSASALLCYHPPIFEPFKRLTSDSRAGRLVLRAARMGLAIYSPHTALDAAAGGMTDWLADGLAAGSTEVDRRALIPHGSAPHDGPPEQVKVVTFVPEGRTEQVRAALASAGAGVIGNYTFCSFASMGAGTFLGGSGSAPVVGQAGRLEYVAELRLEMVCPRSALPAALAALRRAHPYEEPAIEVYPLAARPSRAVGAGRVVTLEAPVGAGELARRLRVLAGLQEGRTQLAPDAQRPVRRLAACPGAGGSLIGAAAGAGCDAIITGEMKHHEVLAALAAGLSVVLAGHTETERGYLPALARRLGAELPGVELKVSASDAPPLRFG